MTAASPLVPADRVRARAWAAELADELARDGDELNDPSLAGGSAGVAILFADLHARSSAPRWAHAADDAMSRAADGIVERLTTYGVGLYSGLAGVAWAELIVDGLLGREPMVNSVVTDVLQAVAGDHESWPWELTRGLVGMAVYAAQCVELGSPPQLLASICERLLRDSRAGTWITDSDLLFGDGQSVRPRYYIDFGMAHGIAGIVALAALMAEPGGPPAAHELLKRSAAALTASPPPSRSTAAGSAQTLTTAGLPPRWCYGEVGITMALTLAEQRQPHDANLQRLAEQARQTVTQASASDVADLGLCHGLAGVALTMGRLTHITGDPRCEQACRSWSGRLLDRLDSLGRATDVIDATEAGVLEGAAGIALALLSLADPQPSSWQRMLLLQ